MIKAVEVLGWVLFVVALVGMFANAARARGTSSHRHSHATWLFVVGSFAAAGTLLALAYALGAAGAAETVFTSSRRGGSLWIPAAVFALVAVGAGHRLLKGDPQAEP